MKTPGTLNECDTLKTKNIAILYWSSCLYFLRGRWCVCEVELLLALATWSSCNSVKCGELVYVNIVPVYWEDLYEEVLILCFYARNSLILLGAGVWNRVLLGGPGWPWKFRDPVAYLLLVRFKVCHHSQLLIPILSLGICLQYQKFMLWYWVY